MIKAAVESGLPPTAVILDDPDRGWTWMDTRLIKAYHIKQRYGHFPPWIDQSDRVQFRVDSYVSKSAAAMERFQQKLDDAAAKSKGNTRKAFGKKYYPVPETIDGGSMPTIEEWSEDVKRKKNNS